MKQSIESMLSDFIEQNNIATDEEIRLVSDINGWSEETMLDIIWARTGYRNVKQCVADYYEADDELLEHYGLLDEEDEESDDED